MSATVGPMTYEDLKQMPQDGNRYEIVDGEPVVSPAPTLTHAEIVARLFFLIRAFVLQHKLGGRVFTAPVDVRLAALRIVEPDIVYVSRERRGIMADPALIDGAPDLVVEVLSPSNRAYDQQVKFRLYAQAGFASTGWPITSSQRCRSSCCVTAGTCWSRPWQAWPAPSFCRGSKSTSSLCLTTCRNNRADHHGNDGTRFVPVQSAPTA